MANKFYIDNLNGVGIQTDGAVVISIEPQTPWLEMNPDQAEVLALELVRRAAQVRLQRGE